MTLEKVKKKAKITSDQFKQKETWHYNIIRQNRNDGKTAVNGIKKIILWITVRLIHRMTLHKTMYSKKLETLEDGGNIIVIDV